MRDRIGILRSHGFDPRVVFLPSVREIWDSWASRVLLDTIEEHLVPFPPALLTGPTPMPSPSRLLLASLLIATGLSFPGLGARDLCAQGPLFLQKGDLVCREGSRAQLVPALTALLAGPDARERARGWTTALPQGIRLVTHHLEQGRLTLVFDTGFLALLRPGADLEQALEQIQKTALRNSTAQRVDLQVQDAIGQSHSLESLLPSTALPGPLRTPPPQLHGVQTVSGALSGKTIFVSPGHGYYYHSTLGWTTQRPTIGGLTEDIHTGEIAMRYLIPALENMGARVISARERGEISLELILDNDQGAKIYKDSGGWTTSGSKGYNNGTYRYTATKGSVTAKAVWSFRVPVSGRYPVQVFYRAGSNRSSAAGYTILHSGGSERVVIDQSKDDRRWVHLGLYWFAKGQDYHVELDNMGPLGKVVIADALRIGAGLGSIVRSSGTSKKPRWQECSRYWIEYVGAPKSVFDTTTSSDRTDDVTARPTYAEWQGADAYISLHTNAGGGTGTSSFIYTQATSGSSALQKAVQSQIVSEIRARYDSTWTDRGRFTANFGELRILKTMPGVLVELAFHDKNGSKDHNAIHDPRFRELTARAYARGVLRYFRSTAVLPPEAPTALRVTQDGKGGLLVAWDGAPRATNYSVEISPDGKGFREVARTSARSWSTGPLPAGSLRSFRVRANNASGRSFPTEVLCAGTSHLRTAPLLLVQGFDRLGKFIKAPENTRDYLRLHGDAIRHDGQFSLGFDAASNEAITFGRISLPRYRVVDWACGEESTRDESFSQAEQFLLRSFVTNGGRLLVSGSEIAWDLGAKGSSSDKLFLSQILGANYVRDDAQTYGFRPTSSSLFASLPSGSFDDGTSGTYDVDYPDVLAPADKSMTADLAYGTGSQIAALHGTRGKGRVVYLGFPLETVTSQSLRASLMQRSLRYLLSPRSLDVPERILRGQTLPLPLSLPTRPGSIYVLAASTATTPGLSLPGLGTLPLKPDALFSLSLGQNNGLFRNFAGLLDAQGHATPRLSLPNQTSLRGIHFYLSGLLLAKNLPLRFTSLLPWYRIRID